MDALGKALVLADTVSAINYIGAKIVIYMLVHQVVWVQKAMANAIL